MDCCLNISPAKPAREDSGWANPDLQPSDASNFETQNPHTALSRVSGICDKACGALRGAVSACGDAVQIAAPRPVRVLVGLVGLGVAGVSLTFLGDADLLDPGEAVERGLEQFALGVFGVVAGVVTTAGAALWN